jgi:hypothetical protein
MDLGRIVPELVPSNGCTPGSSPPGFRQAPTKGGAVCFRAMSRNLARNWDLAVTSSALLLIVGGIALPHLRKISTRARRASD